MRIVVPEFVLKKGDEKIHFPGRTIDSSKPILISLENWELGRAVALAAFAFPSQLIQENGYWAEYAEHKGTGIETTLSYLSSNTREAISGIWETVINEITMERRNSFLAEGYLANLIEILELRSLLAKSPFCISGGETARMMIAAHLASLPACLVLDRVLEHLDIDSRRQLTANVARYMPDGFLVVLEDEFPGFVGETWRLESSRIVFNENIFENGPDVLAEKTLQSPILSFELTYFHPTKNPTQFLEIKNLSGMRAGNKIFEIEYLEARGGNLIWILGKNGTGKSSFFETCIGWLTPGSGSIKFEKDGQILKAKDVVAYSPQDPSSDVTEITMCAEVELARSSHENTGKMKTTEEWLCDLGINKDSISARIADDIALQKIGSVLAALSRGRSFCFLDEPTASLSIALRKAVVTGMIEFLRNGGTILCSTHDSWFYKKILDLSRRTIDSIL